ncbi:MAG: DNA-protecting protein DprA [Bacteroidetes bacterium]|nr:DNA-protecting protein DprA [Bacteroidota bacterium]
MLPKDEQKKFYEIALSLVPDVGPKTVRALLAKYATAEEIFKASVKDLAKTIRITEARAKMFRDKEILKTAELEFEFAQKQNLSILFLTDDQYPQRFLNCDDSSVLLYLKGNTNLNEQKMLAIIGTRKNTDYGQRATEDLIEGLSEVNNLIVVSGLALGIDSVAHKAALKNGLQTIGVLGHGLDCIYPSSNYQLAQDMMLHGGLLTEFPSKTKTIRQNFPVRNRIVAGMSDVTVIVESEVKGGAMITAYVAHSYNRDVCAFPGRSYDNKSSGPNLLIKRNIASLINNTADLLEVMNWGERAAKKAIQKPLFLALSTDEQRIYDTLKDKDALHADELSYQSGFSSAQLAAMLLQMEMQGVIKALPGKRYRLD